MSAVGILCALASEARHFGPSTRHDAAVGLLADGALLAVTGMGARAAALGARSLLRAGAAALVSWGMAGGLDPALAPGAILLPREVKDADGRSLPTDPGWRERLHAAIVRAAILPAIAIGHGTLLTSVQAVGSVTDKAQLFHSTGAAAVDMESFAIGEVAAAGNLPFIAVRVIIDSATDDLPPAVVGAADAHGHLQLGRLIGALARAPAQVAPLLRLAQRYRAANRSLAAIARIGSLTGSAFSADSCAPRPSNGSRRRPSMHP